MSTFAGRVAEAILNEAQSGSAVWDELNGPQAMILPGTPDDDGKFTITIPREYDDEGEPTGAVCRITVEDVSKP